MLAKWVKFYIPLWKPAMFYWFPPVMITLDPRQQKTSWNARISLDKEKLYCHAAYKPGEGQPSDANWKYTQKGEGLGSGLNGQKLQVLCPLWLKSQTASIMNGVTRIEFIISGSTFRMWQAFESMTGCVAEVFLQIWLNFVQARHLRLCRLVLFLLVIWTDQKFPCLSLDLGSPPCLSVVTV